MNQTKNDHEPNIHATPPPTIKHLALSGGGTIIFIQFGILKKALEAGFWQMEDIQTMYGTSAGSLQIALCGFCKLLGWGIVEKFIAERPLRTIFKPEMTDVFSIFFNKGILSLSHVIEIFKPLLYAVDATEHITLLEFYQLTHLEMHFILTDFNQFRKIDCSYKTHPHWKLVDTVYCSCSLPVIFQPIQIENTTFIDGFLFENFPLKSCINNGAHPDEIFGIGKQDRFSPYSPFLPQNNLMDYLMILMDRVFSAHNPTVPFVKNCVFIDNSYAEPNMLYSFLLIAMSKQERTQLLRLGEKIWQYYWLKRECLAQIKHSPQLSEKHCLLKSETQDTQPSSQCFFIGEYPIGY
jgi:predicted acylesterase/phospholipase RssA